jgi:hypothetical protein
VNHQGFLFDENIAHRTIRRLLRERDAAIACWVIGEWGAPAIGTSDPDLLVGVEEHQCILITHNHATMPVHLRDHLANGGHVPGILVVRSRFPPWKLAEDLLLISGASLPDEYRDQIVYWPRG